MTLLCGVILCCAQGDQTGSTLWKSDVTAIGLFSRVSFVEVESFLPLLATRAASKTEVAEGGGRGCDTLD